MAVRPSSSWNVPIGVSAGGSWKSAKQQYLQPGQGLAAAREGRLRFDGDRPMSTHGGRHAFGHAWGASAGSDIYEAVLQMRGKAGKRQMPKRPETAVIHTHGYAMISTAVALGGL